MNLTLVYIESCSVNPGCLNPKDIVNDRELPKYGFSTGWDSVGTDWVRKSMMSMDFHA